MRSDYLRATTNPASLILLVCIALLLTLPLLAGCIQPAPVTVEIKEAQPILTSTDIPAGPVPWPSPDADKLNRDLNDTASLLELPVGGFEEGRAWVSSFNPTNTVNYTIITRNISPTTIELRVFPIEKMRSATPCDPYKDLEVSIVPERVAVEPGRTYTAQIHVNLSSDRYDDTLKLLPYYLQARVENDERIIADDWVIVYAGAAFVPGISGFYRGHTYLTDEDHEITVRAGETVTATYLHQAGIGGTGFVQYNLSQVSGKLNMMPMPQEEKRPFPESMQVSISPNNYTARSFGYYPSTLSIKTDPSHPPGDYVVLIEADGLGTNSLCRVHVVPDQ